MQRKSFQFLALLMLLVLVISSVLPLAAQEAAPSTQPTGPFQIVEVTGDDALGKAAEAGASFTDIPAGMGFFNETEPNDTAATANALPGSQVAVYGTISPAGDYDYFSFTATAGDRVYAATQTQWSNVSGDSRLDIMASDGTTSLEFDDDNGSFSSLSSAIGGTIIPADGTYYVRVYGFSATTVITPYHLHVRVQSGTPTVEVEPNNDLGTATPLAASGWMTGTMLATTDPDLFSFTLNAGDSVYLGLDMDPGRVASNTNWNGRLGLGLFNNFLLVANDGGTTKPHAEAFFMTVQQAGTYYAYVDSTSATGLGANARYNLSVSIYPKQAQNNCTTFTSTDVPKTIGPGVSTTTSTIVLPGTVTSAITDINATIVLTHSIMADLDVTLVGPTAASTPLFTDIGSTATGGQTDMNVGVDDQAALPIGPFAVVSGMVNQPEQPGRLSTFNGTPAGGTWTLQLADDATNTSGGILSSWSLEVCGNPPPAYAIELNKTVGTVPAVCATTDSVTVPPGGFNVYYCYTVRNTGLNTLNVHDLVDSELGTIFTGVNYALAPGTTYSHIQPAMVYDTVTNTGTWTAYNLPDGGPTASDSDTATVNVRSYCPTGFNEVTLDFAFFDNPFPPAGWTVTNTSANCTPPGLPDWTNTNPGNRANLTGGTGPFAIADSDRCGSGSTLDTIMTTGLLDFTGLVSPTVSFNTDYDDIGTGGDQALLDVSTDGGTSWTNLFTWDSDHRGPLLVDQALTGAAGDNDVQVRWHYAQGTYDWWWEVDNAFLTACEPIPSNPAITLDKTVGTDPSVCATTDEITLPYGGGDVTYCYEVENTGDVTLNRHDLVDSELGALLTNFPYTLAPGATAFITETTNIAVTTVNTATWTAYNPADGFVSASATDTATVTVGLPAPAIVLTKTVGLDPNACATTDNITVPPNTNVTYCYTVGNTGNVPFNLHDLTDSELGNILSGFPYTLAPGASVYVTQTTPIAVTTVNTATWTAYNSGVGVGLCSTPNLAIPDNNPTGVSSTLNVPAGGAISDLNVALDITHTWVGDLILSLQHVDTGTTATILNRVGAPPGTVGCSGNDIDNTADDEAALSFENNCTSGANPTQAFVAGQAYQGGDPASSTLLAAFDGEDLSGSWTLTVSDNASQDTGTLNEWCLLSAGSGETASATDTATVNVDQGEPPNIDVSPLSLSATQGPNMITQQQLDIANTGGANLVWTISEEPDGPAAPQAPTTGPAKLGAPAPVERSEKELAELLNSTLVDVVQDGSFEAGTPNPFWTEFSTNFGTPLCDASCGFGNGTGPLTGAWWAWFGGTAAVEAGSLMQSVTIPAGGPATLTFYVEQVECSGNAADYLEVRIDGALLWQTTGAAPECGTLGYRQVSLDVSAFANGGAHMLEFNSETFGSDITNFFVDDVVLDAQGGGGGGTCSAPSDVPWLSTSPTNGTTAGGGSTPVTVSFDSTGLAVGTYNANLCVDSNDPDPGPGNGTDLVIVPVTLTVSSPTAVTLGDLSAAQAPLPAPGLPLATLPVAGSLALLAAYWLRRKR